MNRYILGAPAKVGHELSSIACTPKGRDGDTWHMLMPVSEPDPPKRYSFAEAYKMMKAGKWMRPVTKSYRFKCNSGYWWSYSPHEGERHRAPCLEPSDIESEWEEVIP